MTSLFTPRLYLFIGLLLLVPAAFSVDNSASKNQENSKKEDVQSKDKKDTLIAPLIDLKDISILSISFDAVSIGIDLHVDNPNDQEVTVEEINYSLKLDQTLVKSGRIAQVERFPAKTKRDVSVPISLPYDENVPSILSAIKNMSANYEIFGTVTIKGRKEPLPFSHRSRLGALN